MEPVETAVTRDQPPDEARAREFYEKALALRERGSLNAAAGRFRQAANLGHAAAAYELGIAYNSGTGVGQDMETGAQWLDTAAERGDARAQYLAGAAYFTGTGRVKDHAKAISYLAPAATQGHARAQYLLAQAFANGWGVANDATWAARWYGKAAAQGDKDAQFSYGVLYATGLGLPRNRDTAYEWLTIAMTQGHTEAAKVRKTVAKKMSPAAISRAKASVSRFKPGANTRFADRPTIKYVQHSLNLLKFEAGIVDGVVGPRTRAAIRLHQKAAKLETDGRITPRLLESLIAATRKG